MSSILTFLIILSVLIFVHELGHFLAAKKHGIKVEEFGFGYPPKILGFKKQETEYSLNLLPFGGFVRMRGEDQNRGRRSFYGQPKLTRLIVLLAGVTMNFLLGVVLFGAIYTKLGIPEPVDYLTVTSVAPGSPAETAGIKANDKVTGFSGTQAFIDYVNARRGEVISLTVGDRLVEATPRTIEGTPAGQGALGVGITNIDFVFYPVWQRPVRGVIYGTKEAWGWGREILLSLQTLIGRLVKGEVPQEVAGPVGIYEVSKSASAQGFLAVLQFTGILSINLAILNLLPLPALDGGRVLFILLEIVRRRRVRAEIEQKIHLAGMLLLLALMVLITINDLRRLFG